MIPTESAYLSRMTSLQTEPLTEVPLTIGGRAFRSRLMVGTGKYRNNMEMVRAIEASGAEIVTVAVRRVDLDRTQQQGILYHLHPDQYFLLANTAGCYTAEEAVRYARLAREAGFNEFVKLEVIGDRETLLPDTEGLVAAARELVREGFQVLAYTFWPGGCPGGRWPCPRRRTPACSNSHGVLLVTTRSSGSRHRY
jgi:thiazole synthase ThiGH ThiG subunit